MLTLLAVATLANIPSQSSNRILADGEILAGQIACHDLTIPKSATVWVQADTWISVHGVARIEGRLCMLDADSIERTHAPLLEITSPLLIDIPGTVIGGHGRDGALSAAAGGDGSRIRLAAPAVFIDGTVIAGNGGRGGPARAGGNGGSVHVEGFMLVRHWDPHASIRSGAGGLGSFPAESGASGDAIARVPESVQTSLSDWQPKLALALQSFAGTVEDPTLCAHGSAGADGGNVVSADGAHGADGANGSESSPAGKDGRPGKHSGDAIATDGLPGQNGMSCCPNQGGNGGKGGRGGSATSGKGGNGGKGGNAWNGSAAGGNGGDGGNSGQARAGRAGNGGNSGKLGGVGGSSGDLGVATAGAAGAGGSGGSGTPTGVMGGAGTQGAILQGAAGTPGMGGGPCP
jgi:hypothetical protein